ncbi:MAG: hypothetical protein AN484_27230 [Aphanizomenon flos-aquae WA102]|uniref:Uncharacterized protein n=1 Tax=Aphanizomenon flos-aquae WA102 TaxID=1710896 RepID=A0A1B7W8I6_APHFL|nr:MAG: hypothetical protein AN484_27230 [Aphanizomenon flos-aquae WA102]
MYIQYYANLFFVSNQLSNIKKRMSARGSSTHQRAALETPGSTAALERQEQLPLERQEQLPLERQEQLPLERHEHSPESST